jgi:hypothetical protein
MARAMRELLSTTSFEMLALANSGPCAQASFGSIDARVLIGIAIADPLRYHGFFRR